MNPGFRNVLKHSEVEGITHIPTDPCNLEHHVELWCSKGSIRVFSRFAERAEPTNSVGVEGSLNQLVTSHLHLAWQSVKRNNNTHFLFMYYVRFCFEYLVYSNMKAVF